MHAPILYSADRAALVIAATETAKEAEALLHWAEPTLQQWPRTAWACWLVDASDCAKPRAAMIGADGRLGAWRSFDPAEFLRHGDAARILCDRSGLIFLAPEDVSRVCLRLLDGLAADVVHVSSTSRQAEPFRRHIPAFAKAA